MIKLFVLNTLNLTRVAGSHSPNSFDTQQQQQWDQRGGGTSFKNQWNYNIVDAARSDGTKAISDPCCGYFQHLFSVRFSFILTEVALHGDIIGVCGFGKLQVRQWQQFFFRLGEFSIYFADCQNLLPTSKHGQVSSNETQM